MSTEVYQGRQKKLREVAILVASLEDDLAERLVASMPAEEAAEVRVAMQQLGAVDPDEREDIVAKFRQSTAVQRPTEVEGVELDPSLLARFDELESHADDSKHCAAGEPLESLSAEEVSTVVNMLSAEHPQTISIVLSRLNPASAADLLFKFPATIQAEVLTRMANCDSVDEQSVRVIESQLGQWIDQHRQQRKRMAAGLELVQRIISNTPETHRETVLTQLRGSDPDLAGRLAKKPETLPTFTPRASRLVPEPESEPEPEPKKPNTPSPALKTYPRTPIETPNSQKIINQTVLQPTEKTPPSANPQQELDQLDDTTLMAVLSQTDRQVVTLALAGASEALMKRVLRGLPRRHASKLRSQLRNIGPTRLSDILNAQQQLLHHAHQLKSND